MQQIKQINEGELNYMNIYGSTGPLVYPAGHVGIFQLLYSWTNQGTDIVTAQWIFYGVYMLTLGLVLSIYTFAKAPPYILGFLILSKRLHSIYLLRLFNDCFGTLFSVTSILLLQLNFPSMASAILSLAISVKMNNLLFLPGFLAILLQLPLRGLKFPPMVWYLFRIAVPMAIVQLLLAAPFLTASPQAAYAYLSRAFEFSRVFLYKWTVNWRFITEQVFLSPTFSRALLTLHILLLTFFLVRPRQRWLSFSTKPLHSLLKDLLTFANQRSSFAKLSPSFILVVLAQSNLIGILCARSLHYQFYCWFYWSIPYLIWYGGFNPLAQVAIWLAQEWAWNVYPSTSISSGVVVGSLSLILAFSARKSSIEKDKAN